jgi:uncharacterized protein YodC (DUF2158 family)
MALTTFKPGDVVRLKSGGPAMTVMHEDTLGNAACQWFEKNQLKSGSFPEAVLEAAKPPRSGITVA